MYICKMKFKLLRIIVYIKVCFNFKSSEIKIVQGMYAELHPRRDRYLSTENTSSVYLQLC